MLEEAEDKWRKYVEISGDVEELMMTVTDASTLSEETEGHKRLHYGKLRDMRSLLSKNKPAPVEEKPVIDQGEVLAAAGQHDQVQAAAGQGDQVLAAASQGDQVYEGVDQCRGISQMVSH